MVDRKEERLELRNASDQLGNEWRKHSVSAAAGQRRAGVDSRSLRASVSENEN